MQKKTYTVCVFCGSKSGKNIKYLKMCRVEGFAGISWIKKTAQVYILGRFKFSKKSN